MRKIALGAWEFIVGDDWRVAAGVVLMLGVTAGLVALGLAAWWFSPVATLAILRLAVGRARRRAGA